MVSRVFDSKGERMRRFLISLLSAIFFAGPLAVVTLPAAPLYADPLFNNGTVTFTQGGRSARLAVEIADTPAARVQGLMGRKALPENTGMIFVYPKSGPREFWMKNTLVPLSIAFISQDFTILEILDMHPPADNDNPPSYYSKNTARYALEVNRGWFKRNGFGAGAKVRLE
jgi:uncharacterized membrane protein (UPF0127 family)